MRKKNLVYLGWVCGSLVILPTHGFAQWLDGGGADWQARLGAGASGEHHRLRSVERSSDGGYFLVGAVPDGEEITGFGSGELWLIKLNSHGQKQWERLYGGTSYESGGGVLPTSDGGALLGCDSSSGVSGNKSSPNWGNSDYWIVRVDAAGNSIWDKSYGGELYEGYGGAVAAGEDGFLLYGSSWGQPSGNKSSPWFGMFDCWIVRVDSNGNKLWDASFGGSGQDFLSSVVALPEGGFLLIATSSSASGSGNKGSQNYGANDGWVIRIDDAGNKVWEKSFGGIGDDYLRAAVRARDGGFFLAGYSGSTPSGNKSSPYYGGSFDYWVIKINQDGELEWERSFGGVGSDVATCLALARNGGVYIAGDSTSPQSNSKLGQAFGGQDYWVLQITDAGEQVWDATFGGDADEDVASILPTDDGGFMLGGSSLSEFSGTKQSGTRFYWVYSPDADPLRITLMDYWLSKFVHEPRPGWRYSGTLQSTDFSRFGAFADDFQLSGLDPGREYGLLHQRSAFSTWIPRLRLYDPAQASNLRVADGASVVASLIFTNAPGAAYGLELGSTGSVAGSYIFGLYPLIRPGSVVDESLGLSDLTISDFARNRPIRPNPNSVLYVRDYLIAGLNAGEKIEVSLDSAAFDTYLEVLDFASGSPILADHDSGPSGNSRITLWAGSNTNYLVRVSSYDWDKTGSFVLNARPLLQPGWRQLQAWTSTDRQLAANFFDEFVLDLANYQEGAECAVFLKPANSLLADLRLYDVYSGVSISTQAVVNGLGILLLTNAPSSGLRVRASSLEPGATGDYEIGLYPVVRPGQEVSGDLTVGAAQGSEYHARDYLLWEMSRGQTARLRLESANFDGKLEVVSLSQPTNVLITAEPGSGGPGVAQVEFTHRDENYLVRVTSGTPDQTGNYRLVVERKLPVVTGFSPAGTNVGGTVVLSGDFFPVDNRATTWVSFGGGVWAKPTSPNIQPGTITVTVPAGAVNGPLTVTNLNGSFTSAEVFHVGAEPPRIRALRFGANGEFTMAITGAAGGAVVIETTANLSQPIEWLPVVTNQIPVSGTLLQTVTVTSPGRQQFYRTRMF